MLLGINSIAFIKQNNEEYLSELDIKYKQNVQKLKNKYAKILTIACKMFKYLVK